MGSVILDLTFENFTIKVNALVTKNQAENVLISYNDLVRLGILSPNFPSRIYKPVFSASTSPTHAPTQSTHSTRENDDSASDLTLDDLIEEFADVFDDEKVTPLQNIAPMTISLRRDHPNCKPQKVLTARKVPLHFLSLIHI